MFKSIMLVNLVAKKTADSHPAHESFYKPQPGPRSILDLAFSVGKTQIQNGRGGVYNWFQTVWGRDVNRPLFLGEVVGPVSMN